MDLVLRLGREIADGLDAAHRRGVIHRDIKPSNIWLEAPQGRVKILDFGLARAEGDDVEITRTGTTVGSPAYMAPEQAHGEGGDASSDLFSLGCILYLLCTGRRPFPGTTIMAVLTSLSTFDPPPPRAENPAVPPALDALVMRLLAKEPADRPPSARAVVEAIRGIERARLARRRAAGPTSTASLPVVVSSTRRTPLGIAERRQGPPAAATAQARPVRCPVRIATAALLGMAIVATVVALLWRRTGRLVVIGPARISVTATGPSRAVPEPVQPPSPPGPRILSRAAGPPARAKEESRNEPLRGEKRGESLRAALPDQDRRPREAAKEPETISPVQPAEGGGRPTDWGDVVDPDGDCLVVRDREANRATILITGTARLLSAEIGRMNSPRLLRDITGDFEVRVRVTGTGHPGGKATTTRYAPYHGAGLLLWQDPENYVRLEVAADLRKGKVFPYANFELRQAGRLIVSRGLQIDDGSSHLRLQRRGDEIHGAFSPDGDRWTPLPSMTAHFGPRVQVGVLAVNSSSKPLKAEFEAFRLSSRPGTEFDGDRPGPANRPDHRGVASVSRGGDHR